jgi:hypothetical protein
VDFAANFAAFVPIGLALHRSSRTRALLLAFALSLTIELCQHWLPRLQDVSDLVSNTLGAGLGHGVARAWMARWEGPLLRPVTRRIALLLGAPVLLVAALLASAGSLANDFSNWQHYPLVLGNTAYGDRPWTGEISSVAIFDRALAAEESSASQADPAEPPLWAEGGPILWLRFDGGSVRGRIDGPSGPTRYAPDLVPADTTSAAGLHLVPSGVVLDGWVADHVVDRLREAGRLTLDVRLRSGLRFQHGPARIVSLGDGGRFRNLMLAQRSSGLVARIRTPASGTGGDRAELWTRAGVVTQETQDLRLTYDGSHAVLRVDGGCEDEIDVSLASAPTMLGSFLGLTIVLSVALAALAAASFARQPWLRFVLAAAGAAAAFGLLSGGGAWSHLAGFAPIAALLAALAFAASLPMLRVLR